MKLQEKDIEDSKEIRKLRNMLELALKEKGNLEKTKNCLEHEVSALKEIINE